MESGGGIDGHAADGVFGGGTSVGRFGLGVCVKGRFAAFAGKGYLSGGRGSFGGTSFAYSQSTYRILVETGVNLFLSARAVPMVPPRFES